MDYKYLVISINFEVTITFLAIWLVDAAWFSSDSHWQAGDYKIFQNGGLPCCYHEQRYREICVR